MLSLQGARVWSPGRELRPCMTWSMAQKIGKKRTIQLKNGPENFLDGPVVENPPANAKDVGLIPGLGKSSMLRSK